MVASVPQTFHGSLDIGANHFRTAFDVLFLDDESAAVNIEARLANVDSLQSNAFLCRSHLRYLIIGGTKHGDEVGFLGEQSRRLKRRGGLLNLDGCEIQVVDSCKGRHQKPLRLSRADRPRFTLKIFETLNVGLSATQNVEGFKLQS